MPRGGFSRILSAKPGLAFGAIPVGRLAEELRQERVGGGAGARGQDPLRQHAAILAGLVGIGRGSRVLQHQGSDPWRVPADHRERRVAPHGAAGDHGRLHPEMIHERHRVVGDAIHRQGSIGDGRSAEAAGIESHQPSVRLEGRHLVVPHEEAQGERVEEKHRDTASAIFVVQLRSGDLGPHDGLPLGL